MTVTLAVDKSATILLTVQNGCRCHLIGWSVSDRLQREEPKSRRAELLQSMEPFKNLESVMF